jgi:hypothetical protein
MITLPFQPQFTWRKLGYQYYTNSLEYRAVLELNPQWDVTELPPIGAQLLLPNPESPSGSLQQASFVSGTVEGAQADEIFPFDSESEYVSSLNKYTLQGVVLRESLNGYSFDSLPAITGVQ